MIEIKNKAGDTIRKSMNLRGIVDYARDASPVDEVHISNDIGGGYYHVEFCFFNGSRALATFADWRVAADFVKARRSWRYGDWHNPTACALAQSGPMVTGSNGQAVERYYS